MANAGKAQGSMSTMDLYDSAGTNKVITVCWPGFTVRPSAILWSDRLFVWNGTLTKWVEGWAWYPGVAS